MKRIICSILCTMMLMTIPVSASSSNIDFDSMPDDELVSIQSQINEILIKRGIDNSIQLLIGRYTAGVDIKSGKYIISAGEKERTSVTIRDGEGNVKEYELLDAGESIYASIIENDILEIDDAVAYISEANLILAPYNSTTQSTEQPAK